MNRAVIGIGSNISPEANTGAAIDEIARGQRLLKRSELIWTKPIGTAAQGDFLNGAVLIETDLELESLRRWLREVEDRLGRVRTGDRFGPRTIDLDIVVWNSRVLDRDIYSRDFLRQSVLQVLPELQL